MNDLIPELETAKSIAQKTTDGNTLVSVVVTCYNHAKFLGIAIESVLNQSYSPIEIIVVDDGSTDETRTVSARYERVKYIYQVNAGLSAARNAGLDQSNGDYICFLDADDWLYPVAIASNVSMLSANPEAAFSSGGYDNVNEQGVYQSTYSKEVKGDHYLEMFRMMNYIGMHATVLYRREILLNYRFDTSLRSCEDYDVYLRITRNFPVVHQREVLAAYRRHPQGMSNNIPRMYAYLQKVLLSQKRALKTKEELWAFADARRGWDKYFVNLVSNQKELNSSDLEFLLKKSPLKYLKGRLVKQIKSQSMKKIVPNFVKRLFNLAGLYKNFVPGVGKVNMGDFNRLKPFSTNFGYNRGGPVDRYYIENFLDKYTPSIQGRCLEIGDNEYTLRYGAQRVQQSDILHVDAANEKATFVGDLSDAPHVPDAIFDCIILTQTLHLVYDFEGALKTCHRILKPGGALLITVPGISNIDYHEWGSNWMWSFTEASLRRALERSFPGSDHKLEVHGNVFVASAFLYGMGLPELNKKQLDYFDPHYPVIIAGCIIKK